jgi:hypothetical protein
VSAGATFKARGMKLSDRRVIKNQVYGSGKGDYFRYQNLNANKQIRINSYFQNKATDVGSTLIYVALILGYFMLGIFQ